MLATILWQLASFLFGHPDIDSWRKDNPQSPGQANWVMTVAGVSLQREAVRVAQEIIGIAGEKRRTARAVGRRKWCFQHAKITT